MCAPSTRHWTVLAILIGAGSTFPQPLPTATLDHPLPPTTTLPPLPTQVSDIPQDGRECWNSAFEYSFTRRWLVSEFVKSSTRIVTTFSPPQSFISYYTYNQIMDCITTGFGSTTLCDAVPRAEGRTSNCQTVLTTGSYDGLLYQSDVTLITPTWTSSYDKPYPTCGSSYYLSPACSRMWEAWSWLGSSMRSETSAPAAITSWQFMAIPPCTPLLNTPGPTARPLCKMSAGGYSAYYWPVPTPSGSDFCALNWTAPTATPTIPGKQNTAVISGHTLTSPSLYHFLQNVAVATYRGQAYQPGGLGGFATDIWGPWGSLTKPLTVAQAAETEIIIASKRCIGREADLCSIFFDTDFRIQDLATVRKDKYEKYCRYCFQEDKGTLYQYKYRPTLAIPISSILTQNDGVFADCTWESWEAGDEDGWQSRSSSDFPALQFKDVVSTAFIPITATSIGNRAQTTAVPVPRLSAVATPTGVPGKG